jgi:hypothetical protein
MKNSRLFATILVILAVSGLATGCMTESGNDYNLTQSEKKMQGGSSMGAVQNVSDAYSHAKFVSRS